MRTKKQQLRSKADKLWFQNIFSRNGFCEVCGEIPRQVHHFYPKGLYGHLRYDLDNGVILCMGCHFSHHHRGNPEIHQTIIDKRGKRWHNRLKKRALKRPISSYQTIKYYSDIITKLTKNEQ